VVDNPRIVLAEDDLEMRSLLREWVEELGYVVDEVATGVELAERIADGWLDGDPGAVPALIVSDNRMPGIDGLAVLAALRRVAGEIPFILVTAFGDAELHDRAARLGAARVLDKPVERVRFLSAVQEALSPRSAAAGADRGR